MSFHTLKVLIPTQNDQGQIEQVQQEIDVNTEGVDVVYKQPFKQGVVLLLSGAPMQTPVDPPEEFLNEFAKFESREGGHAYVNPSRVLFYMPLELGVYKIVFPSMPPGANTVIVRETGQDIRRKLTGSTLAL